MCLGILLRYCCIPKASQKHAGPALENWLTEVQLSLGAEKGLEKKRGREEGNKPWFLWCGSFFQGSSGAMSVSRLMLWGSGGARGASLWSPVCFNPNPGTLEADGRGLAV